MIKQFSNRLMLFLLMLLSISCNKGDEPNLKQGDIWATNGIPVFKTLKTFFEYTSEAQKLTVEERFKKENKIGFRSMQTLYEIALEKFETIPENELNDWINDNEKKWKFIEEDGAIDMHYYINRFIDAYGVNKDGDVYIDNYLYHLKDDDDEFYKLLQSKSGLKAVIEVNPVEDYTLDLVNAKLRSEIVLNGETQWLHMIAKKKSGRRYVRYNATYGFEIIDTHSYLSGHMPFCISCETNDGPQLYANVDVLPEQKFETDNCLGLTFWFKCWARPPYAIAIARFATWTDKLPKGVVPDVYQVTENINSNPWQP